jgi:hypothetical protein
MDTKKIEGWVDPGNTELGTFQFAREDCRLNTDIPATLVLGKAFTKDEVEAILREAISKTNDRGAVDVLTIINIAERNGLKP